MATRRCASTSARSCSRSGASAIAQDLAASPDREVALRYRLSNLLFLNAAADLRKDEQGVPTDTYSLDLKVRFEY